MSADIREFGDLTQSPLLEGGNARVIYYLVPNFHNFNAIGVASHGEPVPFSLVAQNTLYAFCYVSIVLLGGLGCLFPAQPQVMLRAANAFAAGRDCFYSGAFSGHRGALQQRIDARNSTAPGRNRRAASSLRRGCSKT